MDQLSPFELKDKLLEYARDFTHDKAATHQLLDAGRGNPNWIATTPREAFFVLGQFALGESKRVWDEPDLGGMPHADGIAARLDRFLTRMPSSRGVELLRRARHYAVAGLGFDDDAFVHELASGIVGDTYPVPDRMLRHCEKLVQRYLDKVMFDGHQPPGRFDLFAVEGGTAAMCYAFDSLVANRVLHKGDTIALGTPIFTPYVELPHLEDYGFHTVEIRQSTMGPDGHHTWQYPADEIAKLADPKIKAFFIVNPSNPASFTIDPESQRQIVKLVREQRPDLIVLTDDVYGTFVDGFRSLAADLPHNTLLVYSYSKHFGCTGWRLGVIALHDDNVIDRKLAQLPPGDRDALRARYASLALEPDRLKFIDRIVADSRRVALNHTAGLSTPQQIQMALFSLFALLDDDDYYARRCRSIVHERFGRLLRGLGVELPDDMRRVGYYADFDLEAWGRAVVGQDFIDYLDEHHEPVEVVIGLAQRFGTVLHNGSGFAGPPWSVRVSLANLDASEYEAIGAHLREIVMTAVARWKALRH